MNLSKRGAVRLRGDWFIIFALESPHVCQIDSSHCSCLLESSLSTYTSKVIRLIALEDLDAKISKFIFPECLPIHKMRLLLEMPISLWRTDCEV